MKAREPRLKVNIPARMRHGVEWVDLRIENLSSRGLMLKTNTALMTGSYVEVRHGRMIIIGRIVWTQGAYSGVRAQDRIDTTAVLRELKSKGAAAAPAAKSQPVERRTDERRLAEHAVEVSNSAERSRVFARLSQFVVMVASVVVGCSVIALGVGRYLRGMSDAVGAALSG